MKPVTLKMKNFGPFTEETVDFTKPKPMFLITGKTGSGKSMIFDAMSFALYGKYSGNRSSLNLDALRSDFAEMGDESFVEFTFSVHDQNAGNKEILYKVKRSIPYEYINRNGNISKKTSEVDLQKFDQESKKFLPMPFKTSEARTKEIASNIIRLPYTDFNQIVLLPQGKFAEFLTETSSDRENTLKKIFPIEDIENVVEKLKEKSKEYKSKEKEITKRIEEITQNGESANSFKQKLAELEEDISKIENESKIADEKIQKLTDKKAKAEASLEMAKKNEETAERISQLEAQKDEIKGLEEKIGKSKKANGFKIEIERCDSAKKHFEKLQDELQAAGNALKTASEKLKQVSEKASEMDKLSKKNDSDENEIRIIKENLEKIKNLQKSQNEKSKIENAIEEFKQATKENDEKIPKLKAELSEIASIFEIKVEEGQEILTALLEKRHEKESAKNEAETLISQLKKIEDEKKKLSQIESDFLQAKKEADESQKIVEAIKTTIERLEADQKTYEDLQKASVLAKLLKPGCPCPVCGSKDHPAPAVQNGKSLEGEIKVQKDALAEKETVANICKERFQKLQNDKDHQEKAIAELTGALEKELNLEQAELALSDAKNAENKAKEKYEQARKLTRELSEAKKKQEADKEDLNELKTKLEKVLSAIEEQEKNIAGDKNEKPADLESKIEKMRADLESNKAKVEKFEKEKSTAESDVKTNTALKESKRLSMDEASQELNEAKESLKKKISESDFTSEEEIKAQMLSESELSQAETRVSSWKTELASQREVFESTKSDKKIKDIESEIEETSGEIKSIAMENEDSNEKIKELSGEKARTKALLDELEEKSEMHKELLKEGEIYMALYRDLNGETGEKNVFTSWILAMHFAEVVDYANERFLELSGGRYQFKIQKTKEQGKHGLDIAINDSENGDRAPGTLSGGETFQASISLALAMTDVICQHSGGIRLDSLFIDEGFGSLDQESLDKAIAALKKIQEQKMVGVISHVEAMETEIKSHVLVDKIDDEGRSKVKIQNFE